jgi:integral membrane protein (TIGR01906 family)
MMNRVWSHVVQWLLVLMLPVSLVVLNVWIATGRWFVRWEYGKAGFPADRGFTLEERTRLAEVCVEYLATGADISLLADLKLPDGEDAFNERELEHMADVQYVYRRTLTVGVVVALVWGSGMVVLFASGDSREHAINAFLGGGLFTLGLLVAVGAFMAVSWHHFFTVFHRIFFEEGTWMFLRTDTLIRLFPERFWMDVAVIIVGLLISEAIMVTAVGWGLKRWKQQSA